MRIWTGLFLLVAALVGALAGALMAVDLEWPPSTDWFDEAVAPIVIGALVAVGVIVAALAGGGTELAARRAWPKRTLSPAPDLVSLATGIALARGEPTPRVWRLHSAAPNIACLPGPGGRHLIVSTAAEAGLTNDELEALMALQFSLLIDPGAARIRRPLTVSGLAIMWTFWLALVTSILMTLRQVQWAGLTINVGVWTAIGGIALVVMAHRRIRWSFGIVGDA